MLNLSSHEPLGHDSLVKSASNADDRASTRLTWAASFPLGHQVYHCPQVASPRHTYALGAALTHSRGANNHGGTAAPHLSPAITRASRKAVAAEVAS